MATPHFFQVLVDVPPQPREDQWFMTQAVLIPSIMSSLNSLILVAGLVSVANLALKACRKALK